MKSNHYGFTCPCKNKYDILYSPVVTHPHHRVFVVSGLPRRRIKTMEDIEMRKKARRKNILIDGIRYYDDKPAQEGNFTMVVSRLCRIGVMTL